MLGYTITGQVHLHTSSNGDRGNVRGAARVWFVMLRPHLSGLQQRYVAAKSPAPLQSFRMRPKGCEVLLCASRFQA